jgi:hypothetical protein
MSFFEELRPDVASQESRASGEEGHGTLGWLHSGFLWMNPS